MFNLYTHVFYLFTQDCVRTSQGKGHEEQSSEALAWVVYTTSQILVPNTC